MCIYVEEGKGRAGLIKLLMTKVYKSTRRRANTAVYFWQRKHERICHVLHEIIEGRMKGRPTTGRRRIHMLHDYPRRARSALGVDTVLTLDVCMFVCLYVCMFVCMFVCMLGL